MGKTVITRMRIKDFEPGSNIAIFGKKHTGKSTLCKWILFYMQKKVKLSIVFSKTSILNHDYDCCIHPLFQYSEYNPKILSNIEMVQIISNENNRIRKKKGMNLKRDGIIIIMDDMSAETKSKKGNWSKDQKFVEFIYNGRHYKVTLILCIHDPMLIPAKNRDNLDYIVITQDLSKTTMEKLYKYYWQDTFDDLKTFAAVMSSCTQKHKMMVINRKKMLNETINDISDIVSYIDVPHPNKLPKKWIVGSPTIHKSLKKLYNPEWQRAKQLDALAQMMGTDSPNIVLN